MMTPIERAAYILNRTGCNCIIAKCRCRKFIATQIEEAQAEAYDIAAELAERHHIESRQVSGLKIARLIRDKISDE